MTREAQAGAEPGGSPGATRPSAPVPALWFAAALTAAPVVTLLVAASAWPSPAARVPVHWSGRGTADSWSDSTTALWFSLLPAVVCAALSLVAAALVGRDSGRRGTASGFAALALVASAAALFWPVAQLTAATASNAIGPAFLLFLLAVPWSLLVFAVAALGRRGERPAAAG